jgi:ribokinase
MSARIVIIGSVNTDMVVTLPHLPSKGETVLGGKFAMVRGGKGANQAVAAARAGGHVAFIGRVGDDAFGVQARSALANEQIDTAMLLTDAKLPSGVALIAVDACGENSIAVAPGANGSVTPDDVRRAQELISSADILVAQLEVPLETIRAAAEIAVRAGVQFVLNPAPAQPLDDTLLRHVSVLIPNEQEAALLTRIAVCDDEGVAAAATALRARGVGTVIITLGARGLYLANSTGGEWLSAHRVTPVDTTAAGDVFTGALAVALGEHRSLVDSCRFASAAAAISVTRHGAQPSAPYRSEVEALLSKIS